MSSSRPTQAKFQGRCQHLAKFTLPVGKKLLQQDYFPVCVFSLWSSENEMVNHTADHALSLMELNHQRKAAIHMNAVKAELKSGLMEGWKSSFDQNAVHF